MHHVTFSVFSLAASWLAYSFCGSFQRHRNVIGSSLVWLLLSLIYLLFFKGVIKKFWRQLDWFHTSFSVERAIYASWSRNQGSWPQARGPRGSIKIAKCAIFRPSWATLNVTNLPGRPQICVACVWNFWRWAFVLRLYLSALLTFYVLLSRYTMHVHFKNETMLFQHYC